jgi:acetoacetyl-CoA reductase
MARVAVVTGGTRGIGAAISKALAEAGYAVAATYSGNDEAAARFHAETGVSVYKWDVGNYEACVAGLAKVAADLGPVDVVINNAGIARDVVFHRMTPEQWTAVININLNSLFNMCRPVIEGMRERGFGRIVNNTTSYVTMLRVLPYGAAKAALESMSAVWAKELDGSGITVNVLVPGGPTDTPLIADASGWPRDKMLRPEIMGPPTAWLVSDEAGEFSAGASRRRAGTRGSNRPTPRNGQAAPLAGPSLPPTRCG